MGACTSYSPDGKHLLCAGYRGALVLDLENGAKTKLTSERVRCAQWISDTQILVSSDLSMLKIMDIVDPSRNTVFSSQTVQALNLAISPDVKTVVTMQGRWTYFWHVPSARLLGKIDLRAESLAFSPDGNHLYATVKNEDTDRYELRVISKSDHQTKRQPKGKLPAPAEPRPPDTAVKN
jgi:WD40 repeat protein